MGLLLRQEFLVEGRDFLDLGLELWQDHCLVSQGESSHSQFFIALVGDDVSRKRHEN